MSKGYVLAAEGVYSDRLYGLWGNWEDLTRYRESNFRGEQYWYRNMNFNIDSPALFNARTGETTTKSVDPTTPHYYICIPKPTNPCPNKVLLHIASGLCLYFPGCIDPAHDHHSHSQLPVSEYLHSTDRKHPTGRFLSGQYSSKSKLILTPDRVGTLYRARLSIRHRTTLSSATCRIVLQPPKGYYFLRLRIIPTDLSASSPYSPPHSFEYQTCNQQGTCISAPKRCSARVLWAADTCLHRPSG